MFAIDCRDKIKEYLYETDENELLHLAEELTGFDSSLKPAYGILKKALYEDLSSLSDKQVILLYHRLIKKVDRRCTICGNIIEPFVINNSDFYGNFCKRHDDNADKD